MSKEVDELRQTAAGLNRDLVHVQAERDALQAELSRVHNTPVSGPYVEQTGEPGAPVARWSNLGEFCEHKLAMAPPGAQVSHVPLSVLREVVALVAEVAAAEERGRVEGAAKERERIAGEITEYADVDVASGITEDEYLHGIYDGLHRGANIARRPS